MIQFAWQDKIQPFVFKTWLENKGQGVKIAVLDTGVDLGHQALRHLDRPGHKFNVAAPAFDPTKPLLVAGNDDVLDLHKKKGHGTQCVSVISALAAGENQLFGFVPQAEVFILKVNTLDNRFFLVKDFLRGLEAAVNLGVDIVVASIAYPMEDIGLEGIPSTEIDRVFDLVSAAGILLLSSLPNVEEDATWEGLAKAHFPTFRPEAVKVGAISEAIFQNRKSEINAAGDIHFLASNAIAPFCKIRNEYEEAAVSSSFATYLAAGVAALYLSAIKNREKTDYRPRPQVDLLKGMSQKFIHLAEATDWGGAVPALYKTAAVHTGQVDGNDA
jgi:subtilisin family serine protease